jgi:hypothetical protein
MSKKNQPSKENLVAIQIGKEILRKHPIFSFIDAFASTAQGENFPADGLARIVLSNSSSYYKYEPVASIELNYYKRASPQEWAYAIAQCHLHIVLNHIDRNISITPGKQKNTENLPRLKKPRWRGIIFFSSDFTYVGAGI